MRGRDRGAAPAAERSLQGLGRSIPVHSRRRSRHGGRTLLCTLILAPGLLTLLKKDKKAQDSWA